MIFLGRLALAFVLGGIIGLEREYHGRPAGLRTHILVGLGSALIMLVSIYGLQGLGANYDPGRIGAGVISGIGFLGAGTILREGLSIRGLTTAASLWMVAAIGLAAGSGMLFVAVVGALGALVALSALHHIEHRFEAKVQAYELEVTVYEPQMKIEAILALVRKYQGRVTGVNIHPEQSHFKLRFRLPQQQSETVLMELLQLGVKVGED